MIVLGVWKARVAKFPETTVFYCFPEPFHKPFMSLIASYLLMAMKYFIEIPLTQPWNIRLISQKP
jgi:hypothetical protein